VRHAIPKSRQHRQTRATVLTQPARLLQESYLGISRFQDTGMQKPRPIRQKAGLLSEGGNLPLAGSVTLPRNRGNDVTLQDKRGWTSGKSRGSDRDTGRGTKPRRILTTSATPARQASLSPKAALVHARPASFALAA
jgi:hypothetical protein